MKGLVLLVSVVAFIFSAQAQEFRPGSLVTAQDEELSGLVRSDFLPGDERIYFQKDASSEIEEFNTDNLRKVEITVKNSIRVTFVQKPVYETYNKPGESRWLQEIVEGPVSLYALADKDYILYCNGNFMSLDNEVSFYLMREEEEAAQHCGTFNQSAFNINADHNFIKLTSTYLSDNVSLYNRLKDREFSILEIPMVVEIYNTSIDQSEKTLP